MLKQHNQVVLTLLMAADACAVTFAWLASYHLRFAYLPVDPDKGVPDLSDRYLPLLPLVVLVHLVVFARVRLYRPRRDGAIWHETRDILKAFVYSIVAVVVIVYALPETNKISRVFILTFAVIGTSLLAILRATVRLAARALRRRGLNRRTAAIVGSGRAGQRLMHALNRNSWTGLDVQYFVDDAGPDKPEALRGVPVRGPLSDLRRLLDEAPVDSIFIALPIERAHRISEVLAALANSTADVRLVPEINPTFAMRPDVSELDGVPILSLRQTPLQGWNAVIKRAFDVLVGALCLLIATPMMLVIAALIKLSDGGPVFYRQRRMGLDRREFMMVKFRTMAVNAEAQGPVWSRKSDERRTPMGAFLRRTSLDELPNLFNVLRGEMSLVGPRPERPEFIEQFKDEIPQYMLRHKMKAGMTGYAQIRGWRGDTSLKKRIQHDVHYIRNWSLALDLRILVQTLGTVWFSKHET